VAVLSRPDLPMPVGAPPLSWRDRLLGARDGLLARPQFQRFVARWPGLRPIARRRAADLFDLCAGFIYSQVLLACVRLRLFDHLASGPRTRDELASLLQLAPERLDLLLEAACGLGLVQRRSRGRWGLGARGAALRGNAGLAAMIEHHALVYADLADPVALLRGAPGGALNRYWPYATAAKPASLGDDAVAPYTALMAASQPMIAAQVIDFYPLQRHRCLLDIGGGDGAFLSAAAAAAPQLRGVLFDLPAVADRASARFRAERLSHRAVAIGGDFFTDRLPEGADLVTLVRIIHDHDDARVLALLRNIRRSMAPGATLLVVEPLAQSAAESGAVGAYFAFYLMAMGSGRPRSFAQLATLLENAGFARIALHKAAMPLLASLVTAQPGP
jgi:demethylspheroidene O-methyltransferase